MFGILSMNSINTSQYFDFFCKLTESRVIYDSDNFLCIIFIIFMIVTFNGVKQDEINNNVSFKDSIEKIIDAVVICKYVIYQSTGIWHS